MHARPLKNTAPYAEHGWPSSALPGAILAIPGATIPFPDAFRSHRGTASPAENRMDYQYLQYNGQSNNGGGGGGRFFIVMAIMMLVFIVLPYFLPRQEPQPQVEDDKAAAVERALAAIPQHAVETRTINTDAYTLTMTNSGGGRIASFHLKDPDRYAEHGEFIRSQKPASDIAGGNLPLAMTMPALGIDAETPFETVTPASDGLREIQFRYNSPEKNFEVVKTFTATDTPYVMHAKLEIKNRTSVPVSDVLTVGMFISQIEGEEPGLFHPGSYVAAKCYTEGEMEYLDATDKDENEKFSKDLRWFAIDESYFAIAMTADFASSCELRNDNGLLQSKLNIPITLAARSLVTYDFDMYLGPKEARYLEYFGEARDLPAIIDYGWIEALAKPMAWILDKFHAFTGNWGLAIILLTVIVRLLLWPIAQKSQISMMRMSKLAPLMKEIQEKYKDDPQTMQQKQMEIYKTHGVSPFGCLPLLLQMPIFFALYRCIFVTGGLYHAPFILWIDDLSAPDPYFVLPILAVALLVGQQLLMPSSTGKNKQQKIMMILMPVIFGIMMLFLPSGLCLYMLVSSTFSMVQSFYVRRLIAKEEGDGPNDGGGKDVIDVENLNSKDRRAAKRRAAEA